MMVMMVMVVMMVMMVMVMVPDDGKVGDGVLIVVFNLEG